MDKAAVAVFRAASLSAAPATISREAPTAEEELKTVLEAIPTLANEDIRHLVVSFGSVEEFARNIYDQELEVLLGVEKARDTRNYLTKSSALVL